MSPPGSPTPAAPSPSQPPPPERKGEKDDKKDDDLSEEDVALKEQLVLHVLRAQDADPVVQKLALENMRHTILTATTLLTSALKPLEIFHPHYATLKSYFETMPESEQKKCMADILSVLALTMSIDRERESLKYRLLGSEGGEIGSWDHEYVRKSAGEIVQEFQMCQDLALKERLELYVVRAQDLDSRVQKLALESMRQEIWSATSSMTSVPKPLKFLLPHYVSRASGPREGGPWLRSS